MRETHGDSQSGRIWDIDQVILQLSVALFPTVSGKEDYFGIHKYHKYHKNGGNIGWLADEDSRY